MLLNLHSNLKELVAVAASEEHAGFGATCGVRLIGLDNGLYRAEATDGRILAVVQGPSDPAACIHVDPCDGVRELVIARADWQKGFALDKKAKFISVISDSTHAVQLCTLSQTLRGQPVEGRFPDVNRVIPSQAPLFSVLIDAAYFIRLLRLFQAFGTDTERRVALHYYGKKGMVVGFSAQNSENGQTLDALIVPLVIKEAS